MPSESRRRPRVVLIAAVARNGVIGDHGAIPWRLAGEQARFKATTMGHPLIMGRATYDSIGRPLPGRTTIVLTRDPAWSAEGALTAGSLEEALDLASGLDDEVYVAGGAAVYAVALPVADVQIISEVDLEPEGDTRYPSYDAAQWREVTREPADGYDVVRLERTSSSDPASRHPASE